MQFYLFLKLSIVDNRFLTMYSFTHKLLIAEVKYTIKYPNIFQLSCFLCIVSQLVYEVSDIIVWLKIQLTPNFPYQSDFWKFCFDISHKVFPESITWSCGMV